MEFFNLEIGSDLTAGLVVVSTKKTLRLEKKAAKMEAKALKARQKANATKQIYTVE